MLLGLHSSSGIAVSSFKFRLQALCRGVGGNFRVGCPERTIEHYAFFSTTQARNHSNREVYPLPQNFLNGLSATVDVAGGVWLAVYTSGDLLWLLDASDISEADHIVNTADT